MSFSKIIAFSCMFFLLPSFVMAGVVSDAQPLTVGLTRILNSLLLIFGAIAILGMLIAGFLYFIAGGDERKVRIAKRAFLASVTGIIITLGSMVLIWTIAQFLG